MAIFNMEQKEKITVKLNDIQNELNALNLSRDILLKR